MQVTHTPCGHILTNTAVWSPDSQWVVFDTRSDVEGAVFDGTTIERVNVETGEIQQVYQSRNGACCGVATVEPQTGRIIFILGPENPTPDWSYCAFHRQGIIVSPLKPGLSHNLDARNLTPPFTPGALRGGSHVHVFSADGQWVSFTYEDSVLAVWPDETPEHQINLRNVGVSIPHGPITVPNTHPRNHNGDYFSVLVTKTVAHPRPGSDEIRKAYEDAWIGTSGYLKQDGTRQNRALAFQGDVARSEHEFHSELFLADLSDDLTQPGEGPLEGTDRKRPFPPKGVTQRRLTFTAHRKYPGLQGPRHWPRSTPDGSRIAFLMRDDAGVVQLWTLSPNGGDPIQLTHNAKSVASAFTWSPDGRLLAHVMDGSVCVTDAKSGKTSRVTARIEDASAPRPEACVFSPNGKQIAYVRRVPSPSGCFNQVFIATLQDLF